MNRRIFLLPGLSIFAVVVEHAISFGIDALYFWTPRYQAYLTPGFDPLQTPQYFILIFLKVLFIFAVPAFFFVSGYFTNYALDNRDAGVKRTTIKARVFNLLGPYLFWTIITILLEAGIGHISTPLQYISQFLLGINGYWFVPVLILFYLLSPGIISIAKKHWKELLLITGLIQIIYIWIRYSWLPSIQGYSPILDFFVNDQNSTFIFNWIFYFPYGVVFGMYAAEIYSRFVRYQKTVLVVCFLLFITIYSLGLWKNVYLRVTEDWFTGLINILSGLYSVTFILSFLLFKEFKIPFTKQLSGLSGRSYGIYLTHYLFMVYIAKLIYHVLPRLLSFQIVFFVLILTLGLGGSLLLMSTLAKSRVRASYSRLFG